MYREEVKWPEGRKNAVMVSINLDAEYFGAALYPEAPVDGSGFEKMAQFGLHEGLKRVLETLGRFGVKATIFIPGRVVEKYPEAVELIRRYDHEISVHGYAHENFALLSEKEQEEAMKKSVDAVQKAFGKAPKGFRAPEGELTLKTFEIAKKCGLTYSSTLGNDDRPYEITLENKDHILEIPYHWAMSDAPYFQFYFWPPVPFGQDRISCFRKVLTNWKWEYDVFREEGLCYVLQLNPMTIGEPGKIYLLEELLSYIQKDPDVWFATGEEICEYFERA